jgi:hypothetical protein
MITVAETAPFQRQISMLLCDDERADLISYLAEQPMAGVLIQGTGGIRKLRWAKPGGGKSGGISVIYYVHSEMMPLYLLAAYGKSEKTNLSTNERNLLARVVRELTAFWRQRNEQSIH